MKRIAGLAALAGLAACSSTPGVDYSARIVPPNTAAVETRTVDVGRFDGPGGRWYEGQFEAMIASASFDGEPWFRLARYTDGSVPEGERAGIYEGIIHVVDYETEEYSQWVTKCVEWDGLFDCEHREEVEEFCLREEIEVSVTPRLIEYGTGEILYQDTYYGDAAQEVCEDHKWRGFGGLVSDIAVGLVVGSNAPRDLVLDALAETLGQIRTDIAPRNGVMRATFIEEAIDPMVRADPRFEQAVEAGPKSPDFSCYMWEDMKAEYANAPAVTHNLGACLEAQGKLVEAHGMYAEAAELSAAITADGRAAEPFSKALARMSYYRSGLELLDRLTAPDGGWEGDWQPVPGGETLGESETLEGGPAEDQAGS